MARPARLTLRGSILLLIVAGLGITAAAPARQAYVQHQQIRQEEARLSELRAKNATLRNRLNRLNDPEYVEKLAREQLGLVRPGEISYAIVPGPTQTATVSPEKPGKTGFFRRIASWFKSVL